VKRFSSGLEAKRIFSGFRTLPRCITIKNSTSKKLNRKMDKKKINKTIHSTT